MFLKNFVKHYEMIIPTSDRKYVSIANCGHSYHNPVECGRDGSEARVLVNLNEVTETGKDETTDANKEDE